MPHLFNLTWFTCQGQRLGDAVPNCTVTLASHNYLVMNMEGATNKKRLKKMAAKNKLNNTVVDVGSGKSKLDLCVQHAIFVIEVKIIIQG